MKNNIMISLLAIIITTSGYALECPTIQSINYVAKQSVREIVQNSLQQGRVNLSDEWFVLPSDTILESEVIAKAVKPGYLEVKNCTYYSVPEGKTKEIILQFQLIDTPKGLKK